MTHVDPSGSEATGSRRCCAFTIVSRNYLHFALNLMASVAVHLPHAARGGAVRCQPRHCPYRRRHGAAGIDALGIEHLDRMVVQYTILELNTAIKPFAFATCSRREGVNRVIYFDPDIQLYSSGSALLQRLDRPEVVLTPHLTAPLADDRHPSDLAIVQSGSYNLGFLALRGTPQTPVCCIGGSASCNATAWSTSRAACSPTRSGWTWCPGCTSTRARRAPPGLERRLLEPGPPARAGPCRGLHGQRAAAVLLPLLGLRARQPADQQAPGPLHARRLHPAVRPVRRLRTHGRRFGRERFAGCPTPSRRWPTARCCPTARGS
jgi:hypothetical protein